MPLEPISADPIYKITSDACIPGNNAGIMALGEGHIRENWVFFVNSATKAW